MRFSLGVSCVLLTASVFADDKSSVSSSPDTPRMVDQVAEADKNDGVPLWEIAPRGNTWVYVDFARLYQFPDFQSIVDGLESKFITNVQEKAERDGLAALKDNGLSLENLSWMAMTAWFHMRFDPTKEIGEQTSFRYLVSAGAAKFDKPIDWNAIGDVFGDFVFGDTYEAILPKLLADPEKTSIGESFADRCLPHYIAGELNGKSKPSEGPSENQLLLAAAADELVGDDLHELLKPCRHAHIAMAHVCDPLTDSTGILELNSVMQQAKFIVFRATMLPNNRDLVLDVAIQPRESYPASELMITMQSFVDANLKASAWPVALLQTLKHGKFREKRGRVFWHIFIKNAFKPAAPNRGKVSSHSPHQLRPPADVQTVAAK